MGKFNLKGKQVLSLLTALFIFAIVLPGCKKQIDHPTDTSINSSSVVTIDQIIVVTIITLQVITAQILHWRHSIQCYLHLFQLTRVLLTQAIHHLAYIWH